jgi:hypothetical protein
MSDLLNSASLVMIPSGYKEDTVFSAIPTDGSGDLSFTRASNGTRVNSAGLVEVVAWNLVDDSERFANWNLQGTSVSTDSTTAPNGTTTADTIIESNTTDEHNRFVEPNIGGGQFTYSVYLKKYNADWCALYVFNTAVGGVRHWVNLSTLTAGTSANIGSGIGTTSISISDVGNGWCRASILFNNPSGACRFYVANAQSNGGSSNYAGNGTSGVYVWGAQVNVGSTAKPYFPTTDRLNVPRLTYQNGGGGCPSLLLEKQSTNYFTYSEQLQTGTGGTLTVTPNTAISPDGTQNADSLGAGYLTKSISATAGTWTFSTFAKYLSSNTFQLYIYDGVYYDATFNVSTGVVTSSSAGVTASIQNMGNGWYRCIMTATTANNVSEIGFGSGNVYAWGCQFEAGSYATSLINTTSASATRVADACYKTGISSLIGQTEGTMFLDFIFKPQANNTDGQIGISDGANSNRVLLWNNFTLNTLGLQLKANGTNQISDVSLGSFVDNTRYKIAVAYKSGNTSVFVNGIEVIANTATFTFSSALTDFILGGYELTYSGHQQVNESVLFKTRLTNAELASLTTI